MPILRRKEIIVLIILIMRNSLAAVSAAPFLNSRRLTMLRIDQWLDDINQVWYTHNRKVANRC